MSFLFSRSNSNSTLSSDAEFSPYPPYSAYTLSTLLASLPTDETGLFVGTVLPSSFAASHGESSSNPNPSQGYGYLSSYPTLVLGLNDLHDLVALVSQYLDVETPFVFSNGGTTAESGASIAIDLDAGRVKRLIDKYVIYLAERKRGVKADFDDEARFAGPYELGMLLRWGLARVIRLDSVVAPQNPETSTRGLTRGLIPYPAYLNWAKQESILGYPSMHYGGLLETRTRVSVPVRVRDEFGSEEVVTKDQYKEVIPKSLKETLSTLFALLAKLVAHSAKSGATPPGLSPLFGPLLFGLGPLPSESSFHPLVSSAAASPDPTSFESTYTAYLRSVHATEHLLLSFIRWQDTPASLGGGAFGAGGVPGRLKEWIKDYPRSLSGHTRVLAIADLLQSGGNRNNKQHTLGPRKGARTIRVLAVRRTVPIYETDLVRSSARWGLANYAVTGGAGLSLNSLPGNKEWGRICPPVQDKGNGGKMPARYSESYRKKMNIPSGVEPGSSPYAPPLSSLSSSTSSYSSYSSYTSSPLTRSTSATSMYSLTDGSPPSSSPTSPSSSHPSNPSSQARFKTLSDAHWGAFESSGFLSPPSSSLTLSSRGVKDIDQALKFDLTETARKARTAKRERESVNWGDFVHAGFDISEAKNPLSLSMSSSLSHSSNYGYGTTKGADPDKSYVGADGKLTDVGDFALDTGLDAALQFNLTEFGMLGGKDKEKPNESKGERERTITAISLGKRLRKKEKPLPPFTYDSTPLLLPGSETLIEAAFIDVWTDLVSWGFAELGLGSNSSSSGTLGLVGDLVMGTWNSSSFFANSDTKAVALNRSISREDDSRDGGNNLDKARWRDELFKECNWVLVEFKALPSNLHTSSSDSKDPRSSTSLILFEEYVPREYRAQLGHQLAGIHPSFILDPAYGHHPFNILNTNSSSAVLTSSPYRSQTTPSLARTRLGSLFSSPGNAGASASTLGLVLTDSARGKKEKRVKEAKSKKEKKDKKNKKEQEQDRERTAPALFFSGSTRTLTSDSRNASTPTPIIIPQSRQLQTSVDSPLTPTGPSPTTLGAIPRPQKDKSEEFDAMLADGNRGTKVITLNGALHTIGPEHGLSSDVEVELTDAEEEAVYSANPHATTHEGGIPLGSGHPLPPVPPSQLHPQQLEPSTPTPSTPSALPQPSTDFSSPAISTPIKNIFRLGPTSTLSSKPSSSISKPIPKPKGPKPKTNRRQSRQNLVPAEYHTVEFETRLTGLGSGEESDADEVRGEHEKLDKANAIHDDLDASTTGDGFLEEAARRRRAARLAERDRLRSERRGKRFSLGLGAKNGDIDDDDEAWVDIVVATHRGLEGKEGETGSNKGIGGRGDPEEASQEVARVLSAVRGGQPYPGMDDESIFEHVDGAEKVNSDSDDIEVQTVPRFGKDGETELHRNGHGPNDDRSYTQSYTSGDLDASAEYDFPEAEDDSDIKPLASSITKRRLGYFDLHPERRRASQEMLKQAADADGLLDVRQPEAMSSQEADMFASGVQHDYHSVGEVDGNEDDDEKHDDDDDDDDPRARYAYGSEDEHDDAPRDLDKIYGAKTEKARPLPTLPSPPNESLSVFVSSTTPPPRSSSLSSSLPATSPPFKPVLAHVTPLSPSPPTKPPIPSTPSILTSPFGSTSGTPGKTAALIEMYREKEKKSLPSSPAPSPGPAMPSKIPVKVAGGLPAIPKSASSPVPTKPLASTPAPSLPTSPAAPVPAAKPLTKSTSLSTSTIGINSQLHDEDDDEDDDVNGLDELVPPSKIGLGLGEDAGRASPGRYIHGAPLHNVLEEEEEED